MENQRHFSIVANGFKNEIPNCTNPKSDKVCFDAKIEAKFNNNTSILDKILNNQRSPEDTFGLGYDKTTKEVYNNIPSTNKQDIK